MEKFEVGEKVRFTLLGKGRLSRIVSFVPSIGGGILATVVVEGKEYAVSTESLQKIDKKKNE